MKKLAETTALVILGVYAAWFVLGSICRIHSPIELDYGPAWLALTVQRIHLGQTPYLSLQSKGIVLPYNPLSLYAAAFFMPLFHGPLASLEAGRLVVVCSTIICGFLVFLLGQKAGAPWPCAAITALCFLVSPLFDQMGFEFRADVPALAMELGGLYFAYSLFSVSQEPSSTETAMVVCFVWAFFTKQNFVAGIGAILLYLSLNRQWSATLIIGFGFALSIGVAIFGVHLFWPAYIADVFYSLAPVYVPRAALAMDFPYLFHHFALLALAGAWCFYQGPKHSLAVCYFLTAAALNTFASLRWGSSGYYFLPTIAAAAICAAPMLGVLLESITAPAFALIAGLAIPCAAISMHGSLIQLGALLPHHLGCAEESQAPWQKPVLERLRASQGPILTVVPEVTFVNPALHVEYGDPMLLASLHMTGRYDDTQLLRDIEAHHFALIVLNAQGLDLSWQGRQFFWPALRSAIEANYRVVAGPPYLLIPR